MNKVGTLSVLFAVGMLAGIGVAQAGPPSKTAVVTKLSCDNTVGAATATVTLCDTSYPGPCFGGTTYVCAQLSCGPDSTSGLKSETLVCDAGFDPAAFSYDIDYTGATSGGCFGGSSSFGSVICPGVRSPKLTVR